jgi:hypothetical protein
VGDPLGLSDYIILIVLVGTLMYLVLTKPYIMREEFVLALTMILITGLSLLIYYAP